MVVFVPKKDTSFFNLYVYTKVSHMEPVEELGYSIHTSPISVLLYKYPNYRRAYVVTDAKPGSALPRTSLPSVTGSTNIIYMATGRRADLLKSMCYSMEKEYGKEIWTYPALYWQRMTSLLNHFNGKTSAANRYNIALLHKQLKGQLL